MNIPKEVFDIVLDWVSGVGQLVHFWEERVEDYSTFYVVWCIPDFSIYCFKVFKLGDKWNLSQDKKYSL